MDYWALQFFLLMANLKLKIIKNVSSKLCFDITQFEIKNAFLSIATFIFLANLQFKVSKTDLIVFSMK